MAFAALLEIFINQMFAALSGLRGAGLVHRDVHPDNIFLKWNRVKQRLEDLFDLEDLPDLADRPSLAELGLPERIIEVTFILVDCTFVINSSEARRAAPVAHGVFTPPEQIAGRPTYASDIYALGATTFKGITGEDIPSQLERSRDRAWLNSLPSGGHPNNRFPDFFAKMLSMAPSKRPLEVSEHLDTYESEFTGALFLKNPRGVLVIDRFLSNVDVLEPAVAVERLEEEARLAREHLTSPYEEEREAAQRLLKLLELMLGTLHGGVA